MGEDVEFNKSGPWMPDPLPALPSLMRGRGSGMNIPGAVWGGAGMPAITYTTNNTGPAVYASASDILAGANG